MDLILSDLTDNDHIRPELMKIQEAGLHIQEIVKQMQNINKYVTSKAPQSLSKNLATHCIMKTFPMNSNFSNCSHCN